MLRLARRIRLAVLVMASLALLAGCGTGSVMRGATPRSTPAMPMPIALQIVRFAPHQDQAAPFMAQTEDAAKVQQLFATLRALPPFWPTFSCPNDQGGGYLLTFLDHNSIVAEATIAAGGCPKVSMSAPYGCHKPDDTTLSQVADTLDVQPSAIGTMGAFYDTATPGSQLAPEDLSVPLLPFSHCL